MSPLKKCSICEQEKVFPDDYYHNRKTGKPSYSWCKKCHIVRGSEFRRTPIGMLTEIKKDAKKRGIDFTLELYDIEGFWQKPCTYCGEKLELVSIDRVDNSIGYVYGNVVPCCRWCNYTKGNGSAKFFYEQCKKVVDNIPASLKEAGEVSDGGERYPYKKAHR